MTLLADFVTNKPLSFQRMRALLLEQGGGIQEGIIGAGDLLVAQRAAGATMTVDVSAGAGWVQVDTGTRNGISHVYSDAVANLPIAAAHATLPRVDQVVLRYNDSSLPTGAGDVPTLEVIAGTPTTGATLDNRTGAAALPNDCLRLADVLVGAAAGSITNAVIRDRRPWARGFNWGNRAAAGADFTTASTTLVSLAAGVLDGAFEKGANSFVEIEIEWEASINPAALGSLSLNIDGSSTRLGRWQGNAAAKTAMHIKYRDHLPVNLSIALPPGRHLWALQFNSSVGTSTSTITGSDGRVNPHVFVRETVMQPAAINAFTP